MLSYLFASVYFVRTTSVIMCIHTSIYIYIYIGLASSNVSRRIRLEPVHTHNLFLFSIRLRCLDVTREKWTIEMRKYHWCERNFFYAIVIVASSILSRNDLRLIKLVQCVNLIRRFLFFSPAFDVVLHTHTFHPLCFNKLVCVLCH